MSFEDEPTRGATATGLSLRVRRAPVSRYSELDEAGAREHRAWHQRMDAIVGKGYASVGTRPKRRVDKISRQLLAISGRLSDAYGTPDLGNKSDPVDELVYIILSRRTREGAYQPAYAALKAKYTSWEELAAAPAVDIFEVISFSGLGHRKAQSLKLALGALIDRFGRCTLDPTIAWDDEQTRDFLCTLPEIGPKSAACVMVCSLDRPAFPVDAHVGRVLERLGIFRTLGIDLGGVDHKVKQRLLWDAVPPSLRYTLHVNALIHGRVTCLPGRPRCASCVIANYCEHARDNIDAPARSSRGAR
jgi:endonuclease III